MSKFRVTLTKTVLQEADVVVEAANEAAAQEVALAIIGTDGDQLIEWDDGETDFGVMGVEKEMPPTSEAAQ